MKHSFENFQNFYIKSNSVLWVTWNFQFVDINVAYEYFMDLGVLANRMLISANYVVCDTKVKIIYRVSFLVKSNCRWSIKKISGTPPGEVEGFLIF